MDFFSRRAILKYDSPVTATWIYLLGTNENDNKQSKIRMYYQGPGDNNWQKGIHHLPFRRDSSKFAIFNMFAIKLSIMFACMARWLNAKTFSNFFSYPTFKCRG